MKEIKFRIIELPTHQVLLMKDFNNDENDEDAYLMCFIVFQEGVKMTQTLGYASEEMRDKMFIKVSDEHAQTTVNSILSMLES